jgi:hypothetical protein
MVGMGVVDLFTREFLYAPGADPPDHRYGDTSIHVHAPPVALFTVLLPIKYSCSSCELGCLLPGAIAETWEPLHDAQHPSYTALVLQLQQSIAGFNMT